LQRDQSEGPDARRAGAHVERRPGWNGEALRGLAPRSEARRVASVRLHKQPQARLDALQVGVLPKPGGCVLDGRVIEDAVDANRDPPRERVRLDAVGVPVALRLDVIGVLLKIA